MKITKKLIILLVLMILSTICIFKTNVYAVGNVYQSWVNVDDSNNRYMLYRLFLYPNKDAVNTYTYIRVYDGDEPIPGYTYRAYKEQNNGSYTDEGDKQSKWVYRRDIYQGQTTRPNFPEVYGSEKTVGAIFHKNPTSEYTDTTERPNLNNYNYKSKVVAYNYTTTKITQDFEEIKVAFNNSEARYVTLSNSSKLTSPHFDDNNNIILEQSTSTRPIEENSRVGTGLSMKADAETVTANEIEYRYALVGVYEGKEFKENIWIKDNIVGGDDLNTLITNVKGLSSCYASNVMAARTRNTSLRTKADSILTAPFEVAKSAANFFNMYPYNVDNAAYNKLSGTDYSSGRGAGYIWNKTAKGVEEGTKALGSIVNMYDNVVEFPQWSTRKVIVRHINIGDNTTISLPIVNSATRIVPKNPTLLLDNPKATINSEAIPEDIDGEEYYTSIEIDRGITKTALDDSNTYKCIGYNISVSGSYEEAKVALNNKIRTRSYEQYNDEGITIEGKDTTSNDECIIIDFYYTEKDKDVYVNHIYINRNGVVRGAEEQIIEANRTAIMGNVEINNKSTKTIVEEIYSKKLGLDVITTTAKSLDTLIEQGDKIFYQGYELFDEAKDINTLIGKEIIIPSNNTSKEVAISGDKVQVNYYYYVDDRIVQSPPNKTIGGNVFANVTGENQIEGACTDTGTGFSIKSVPTQTTLKLGIENIPKAMISAIQTEYQKPSKNTNTIAIGLKIDLFGSSRTISFANVKYSVGYYKITDMLVHRLKQTTIYDADSTEVKTVGSNLFSDWNDNKITLVPNKFTLPVELIGINGEIENKKASIDNLRNYVKVYLKDKYGNTSNNMNSNGMISMSYNNNYEISSDEYQLIFSGANNVQIAKALGLKIVIEVQNMTVKIGGEIINSSNDKVVKEFDLSNYLISKETMQVTTNAPTFKKEMYNSIGNITVNDYSNSNKINTNILNGIRTIAGKAEYEPVIVIGDKNQVKVTDTVYYSEQNSDTQTVVFEADNQSITKVYEINNDATNNADKYKEVAMLNVYTPITVTTSFKSENNIIVDQTEDINVDTNAIQINTPFTITLNNEQRVDMYDIDSTKKYNGGYYIKFDFDVHQVKINGVLHQDGKKIAANTWIGPIHRNKKDKASITAQAYGDLRNGNTVSEENCSYTVRAVAQNITDLMRTLSLEYANIEDMLTYNTTLKDFMNNICDASSYFSESKEEVAIINRLYDFRVTDLKDLGWKNVFRKSSGSTTNVHTGNVYHSGTTKWNASSEKINEIINRTSSEIGRNPLRILPLGPYKNTDTTYIKAPKLGYRFSFDMKVTGTYSINKKIGITTKFYYISKDGKTFIEEYNGENEGVYLFYKNSSGKYVRIDETNGGGYNLTFIPNDGYRYIEDTDKSKLSTSTVSLGNLRNVTLNHLMATTSSGESYVTYYGEYKLPNSTIVVKVNEDGKYDINKPLTDGYVGVIFDIKAYTGTIISNNQTQAVNLSYSKDTRGTNTSQWDYEGFLGHTKYGTEVASNLLSLRLEKGKWNIDNETYNKIKGSVILYDIDQRAATDYE